MKVHYHYTEYFKQTLLTLFINIAGRKCLAIAPQKTINHDNDDDTIILTTLSKMSSV